MPVSQHFLWASGCPWALSFLSIGLREWRVFPLRLQMRDRAQDNTLFGDLVSSDSKVYQLTASWLWTLQCVCVCVLLQTCGCVVTLHLCVPVCTDVWCYGWAHLCMCPFMCLFTHMCACVYACVPCAYLCMYIFRFMCDPIGTSAHMHDINCLCTPMPVFWYACAYECV